MSYPLASASSLTLFRMCEKNSCVRPLMVSSTNNTPILLDLFVLSSLAAAFVMSTGATEMPIKLSKEEKDFADYLLPFAKAVVAANGDKYRDTMNTLLTASGSGEKV